MSCAEFDTKLDFYLDAVLPAREQLEFARHLDSCISCTDAVIGYQKVRALLTTAVTDRVAAVDVSGLWDRIAARLPEGVSVGTRPPRPVPAAVASGTRFGAAVRGLRDWLVGFVAPLPLSIRLGVVGAAAVAGVLAFSIHSESPREPTVVAEFPPRTTDAGRKRTDVRPVRIDSMEVAAGHTVSTWVKPRTRTRVIWVADADLDGFGVGNVSHTR